MPATGAVHDTGQLAGEACCPGAAVASPLATLGPAGESGRGWAVAEGPRSGARGIGCRLRRTGALAQHCDGEGGEGDGEASSAVGDSPLGQISVCRRGGWLLLLETAGLCRDCQQFVATAPPRTARTALAEAMPAIPKTHLARVAAR